MRIFKFFLIVLTGSGLVLPFQSCDCKRVDCDPGYLNTPFLSKADDSNLFSNGTYQRDSLHLFALNSDLTVTDFTDRLTGWQMSGHSEVYFPMDKNAVGYIYRFNSQEQDTLMVNVATEDSDCCGEVPSLVYGIYRGDTVLPNAGGYLLLKK